MAPSAITITEEYTPLCFKTALSADNTFAPSDNHSGHVAKKLIGDALRARVDSVDQDICGAGEEDAFFVADLGEVYRQHLRWKKNLARVKPHYGKPFWLEYGDHPRLTQLQL
jgi:ornithine decarboxylase